MMELQQQLYLITGILSGCILLLLAFTIVLAMQIKKEKKERLKNESRFLHAADPSIHHGEELQRRGFGMYQGDPEPHKPLQRQDSHMHHHHEPHHHQHHDSHHGHHGNIPSLHSSQYQGMQQPHSGIRKHNAKY